MAQERQKKSVKEGLFGSGAQCCCWPKWKCTERTKSGRWWNGRNRVKGLSDQSVFARAFIQSIVWMFGSCFLFGAGMCSFHSTTEWLNHSGLCIICWHIWEILLCAPVWETGQSVQATGDDSFSKQLSQQEKLLFLQWRLLESPKRDNQSINSVVQVLNACLFFSPFSFSRTTNSRLHGSLNIFVVYVIEYWTRYFDGEKTRNSTKFDFSFTKKAVYGERESECGPLVWSKRMKEFGQQFYILKEAIKCHQQFTLAGWILFMDCCGCFCSWLMAIRHRWLAPKCKFSVNICRQTVVMVCRVTRMVLVP